MIFVFLQRVPGLTFQNLVPEILANRRGKNMHRARAQLEALENEGKVSEIIKSFILKTYVEQIDNTNLMRLWDELMSLYKNFTGARIGDEQADFRRANEKV